MINPLSLLRSLFDVAVESARPHKVLPEYIPTNHTGRIIVIGAGKGSAAMAQVLENHINAPLSGCVVTRYGHAVPCKHIEILEASHPVADEASVNAANKIMRTVSGLTDNDLVIVLISGGGSALLALPAAGITLADKQNINAQLLKCGASISEINTVRRHLSAIKGGHLAAACYPAQVCNLIISDVPGDDPNNIASGPTVADPTTCANALNILKRYHINAPVNVINALKSGTTETIKPGDNKLAKVNTHIVASSQKALLAAATKARAAGYAPIILGDSIEGEAREVAKVMAAIAQQVKNHSQPAAAPCILLSGGETTVTIKNKGSGGRNVEFLLALAVALNGTNGIYAIAGDTDGIDGQEEIAGAVICPETINKALNLGLSATQYLDNNDAHTFFKALGDSVITGPTLTNVNDFRAILITT